MATESEAESPDTDRSDREHGDPEPDAEPGLWGNGPWPLNWHISPDELDLDGDGLLYDPFMGIEDDVDVRARLDEDELAAFRAEFAPLSSRVRKTRRLSYLSMLTIIGFPYGLWLGWKHRQLKKQARDVLADYDLRSTIRVSLDRPVDDLIDDLERADELTAELSKEYQEAERALSERRTSLKRWGLFYVLATIALLPVAWLVVPVLIQLYYVFQGRAARRERKLIDEKLDELNGAYEALTS